jgi:hypothetical protein
MDVLKESVEHASKGRAKNGRTAKTRAAVGSRRRRKQRAG